MTYDYHDQAMDEAYERLSEELYPGHKAQAIIEFTYERLRSYYLQNKDVLLPAVRMFKTAESLLQTQQYAASLVFSASAIELFLKACLLRPVVAGLIHSESMAELFVESTLSQTGFKRYDKLLAGLFKELTQLELREIKRSDVQKSLFEEASSLQEKRNAVVHRGQDVSEAEANEAFTISKSVFDLVLAVVLKELGLLVEKGGKLVDGEA